MFGARSPAEFGQILPPEHPMYSGGGKKKDTKWKDVKPKGANDTKK